MLLADMHPEIKAGVLLFDCPCGKHRMRVPISAERALNGVWWKMSGELPNVTLRSPTGPQHSIDASPCFHMTLTDGKFV